MNEKYKIEVESVQEDLVSFLREIVEIPSPSCEEKEVAERVKSEMEKLGYDEVRIDSFGNVIGKLGDGNKIILYDSHMDTVGIGDPDSWSHDPYKGKVEDGIIYGRGTGDNKGGLASMIYGGAVAKKMGMLEGVTLYVVGSAQEEVSDGLAYKTVITEDGLRPDVVVLGECTGLKIYRGQRGRMEITVTTRGLSCHASAPDRGENAIYKMTRIINGIEQLNSDLKDDDFLGKGTVAVTKMEVDTPSLNAIPDKAVIYIDRRLTAGETKESALAEISEIAGNDGEVEVSQYESTSYTGKKDGMEKYYPTWHLEPGHPALKAAEAAYREIFGEEPVVDKWTFSTNGVYTAGIEGIPTFGLGPSVEEVTHSVNDQVSISDLLSAAAFYAGYPSFYSNGAE
ncbi:MAG: YgeY family selenium metabolism-linked hydrolase [Candidatus Marinimicrobia bacterium]|nr:YgeY family selenium metabolism-linked hydrolase [Candidatus Neomarinimicrobiota bacterium]